MVYAAFQNLETERLRLRKLTMEDVPQFYARLGSSQSVTQFMLWKPHQSISESEDSIRKTLRRYEAGHCYRWGIVSKTKDSLIGMIDLLHFDEEAETCSFAYMLGEDYWGSGYGTEAVNAVFAFAFTSLQLSAILADHFAENPASGAVMRKAGMRYVQTIPQKYEKNGRKYDAVEYCITREDWNKARY